MNWTKIVRRGLLVVIPMAFLLNGCGRGGGMMPRAGGQGFGGQQGNGGQRGFGGQQAFGGGRNFGQDFGQRVQGDQMGNFGLDERLAGIRRVNDAQTTDIRNIDARLRNLESRVQPQQPAVTTRPTSPTNIPPAVPPAVTSGGRNFTDDQLLNYASVKETGGDLNTAELQSIDSYIASTPRGELTGRAATYQDLYHSAP